MTNKILKVKIKKFWNAEMDFFIAIIIFAMFSAASSLWKVKTKLCMLCMI